MEPYSSPYISHYSNFHVLVHSVFPANQVQKIAQSFGQLIFLGAALSYLGRARLKNTLLTEKLGSALVLPFGVLLGWFRDLVSRLITPITLIVTLGILTIDLLIKSP